MARKSSGSGKPGRARKPAAGKAPKLTKAQEYVKKHQKAALKLISPGLGAKQKSTLKKIILGEKVLPNDVVKAVKQGGIGFKTFLQAEFVHNLNLSAKSHLPTRTRQARRDIYQTALISSAVTFEVAGKPIPPEAQKLLSRVSPKPAAKTGRKIARAKAKSKAQKPGKLFVGTVNALKKKGLSTQGKSTPAFYREAFEKGLVTRADIFLAEYDRLASKNPRWSRTGLMQEAEKNVKAALKGARGKGWY